MAVRVPKSVDTVAVIRAMVRVLKKDSVECSFRLLLSADMNIAAGKCRNEADMDTLNEALGLKIPQHVAVILDGNGRWAKQRHMPRT